MTRLSRREARLVRELARTPGRPVHWSILADAVGESVTLPGKYRTQAVVQRIRNKFGGTRSSPHQQARARATTCPEIG